MGVLHRRHAPESGRRRRTPTVVLAALVAVVLVVGGGVLNSTRQHTDEEDKVLPVRGADISFTLQEERAGQQVSDNGSIEPVEQILAAHGANYVRLRVWVDPVEGTSDLASALILGRRAKAAGSQLLLDLHYSDTWADRTTQQTPAAWSGLTLEQLLPTVESYSRDVVAAFARQGTPASMVQIGNEVVHGMMWPIGQIYHPWGQDWNNFTALLSAGAKGARQGNPTQPPAIVIHTDTGGDAAGSAYFFDQLRAAGVDYSTLR